MTLATRLKFTRNLLMNRNLPALALVVFSFLSASAQNITLDEVVSAALEKNYDVRVLQQTSAVAANDLRFSFGAFIPQINATGSYVKNNNNSQNITFSDVETIRNGAKSTLTNGSVQMVWTLFDGTKMFATRNRLEQLASLGQ